MKKYIGLIISIFILNFVVAQNHKENFEKYFNGNDTINQLKKLQAWEKENPKDPELYTSYFNYYVSLSRKTAIRMTTEQPEGDVFVLKDSLNKTAGFLCDYTYYEENLLSKGFKKIDKGIYLFPKRLDMRFGKIYSYGKIKNWELFTKEIITAVEYSNKINNEWLWTDNEKVEDSKNMFLSSIQDYQLQLYNTNDDKLLKNMREIAKKILEYYPNHVESLSNIAITYLLANEYDKAISYLLKAEKINPKDYIVLSNIAEGYKRKGDKERAIEYYEKTFKFGDEQAKAYSKQQIEKLKK